MRTLAIFLLLTCSIEAQRFRSDDPLLREPTPRPVTKATNRKFSDYYDLFSHQFGPPGEHQPKKGPPVEAQAVNSLGEPMDGGWYTKRHYYRRMSLAELSDGPGGKTPPSTNGKWTIVSAKSEGVTPGFVILDASKQRYFIKFDPIPYPEMATAADSIGARFFYALGYNVPDNYIVFFKPDQLTIGENVMLLDESGKERKMNSGDIAQVLRKVPLTKDGLYRATASKAVDGKPIGPPRYYGTRKDDPNDIVLHEHRRDLRGLQVFCAWLGHDDSRSINNLDALVVSEGVQSVRHFLLDFGSILGSASFRANSARSGDYFFSWKSSATEFFTLGLKPQYWAFAHYPKYPSVGNFESKVFDPEKWVPEYPNPAFMNRLPDDEFWAAKQVMAFDDKEIDAIVATGMYTDPKAAAYVAECIRERRNKIGKAYFNKVLPFDRFRVESGKLAWDDLAKIHLSAGVADASVSWSRFNNLSGELSPIGGAGGPSLPSGGDFLAAKISSAARPKQTITVYVRHSAAMDQIVGIDRTW